MVHLIAAEKFHNGPYEKVKIVIIKIRTTDIVALRGSKAAFPIFNGHLGNSSARPRDVIFFYYIFRYLFKNYFSIWSKVFFFIFYKF